MRAVVAVPAPCGRCSMFAWHQRRQPFALAGAKSCEHAKCCDLLAAQLALLGSTKTRGLRVDAAHVDVALRSPSKTTPSASCSGRGAPSRRGRRAGVNARTTGNLLTQGSQAPGQTALRRNTRMQFRKLGCLAHLRSMRVAFRSCSYPRSTKVLITAFGPFGLTWPREPCNG